MDFKVKINQSIKEIKQSNTHILSLNDFVSKSSGELQTIYINKLSEQLKKHRVLLKDLKKTLEDYFIYEREIGAPFSLNLRKVYKLIKV